MSLRTIKIDKTSAVIIMEALDMWLCRWGAECPNAEIPEEFMRLHKIVTQINIDNEKKERNEINSYAFNR